MEIERKTDSSDAVILRLKKFQFESKIIGIILVSTTILSLIEILPIYYFLVAIIFFIGWVYSLFYRAVRCPNCGETQKKQDGTATFSTIKCLACGIVFDAPKREKYIIVNKIPDEGAKAIDWTPVNAVKATFNTHKLIENHRLEYHPTKKFIIFSGLFIVVGIIFTYNLYINFPDSVQKFDYENLIILVPILFIIAGSIFMFFGGMPIRFDKEKMVFYKGWGANKNINHVYIDNIIAIQLLSTTQLRSDGESNGSMYYENFEINLVLNNFTRKNVISLADRKTAIKDAKTISNYLNVKFWSAVEEL